MTTQPKKQGGARPGAGAKLKPNKLIFIYSKVPLDRVNIFGGIEKVKQYLQEIADKI